MSAVWQLDLPGTEKLVLLALADWSNDHGDCWPSMAQLAQKSGLTDRAVRGIIGRLVKKGHLKRDENIGKGVNYTVNPGTSFPPEQSSPRKETTKTPERRSSNTSRTTIPKKDKPSLERATRLPDNFTPILTAKVSAIVAEWPPGRLDDELDQFRDHHTAKGTTSKDWQASLRTWIRNAQKWTPRNGRQSDSQSGSLRGSRPDPALDFLRAANADLEAECRGSADRGRDWLALPARGTS